jgi:tetratricopeptide (TPR) repeat protein
MLGSKPPYLFPSETWQAYCLAQKSKPQEALGKLQSVLQGIRGSQTDTEFLSNEWAATLHSDIGNTQEALGDNKGAIASFRESASVSMQTGNHYQAENAFKTLALAHQHNGTLANYEQETNDSLNSSLNTKDQSAELSARLALGAIKRAQGKHDEALEHYAVAYDLQQGKVDYEAVRVEQHEVGFSTQKIGTDNIQQCVAVILHDPITKKTALAHIDRFTDTKSLADVIAKFSPGTKLNAHLVG